MPDVSGGCYCGNIRLSVTFSQDLSAYTPRACDCDFCRKHGAAYVSDPAGSLVVRVTDERELSRFRQGSNTAEMLLCRRCGVLVGALYQEADELFGTVNAQSLESRTFATEQSVSPKALSADRKVRRWREIWFPKLVLQTARLPATPVLKSERLVLRPLRLADAPAAQRYFPRWEIVRWLNAIVPWPYPDNGAESYFREALEQVARGERFIWAICLQETPGDLIGIIELRPDDGSRDQRGFWLATEFQGRGLITEAADRVTEYAFTELGWPHLWLTNARANVASRRVKERQGAQLVETQENRYVAGVGVGEIWLLTREDWTRRRAHTQG
jgi:[ribosomal protein S5]-alanine N-acetyltransferase